MSEFRCPSIGMMPIGPVEDWPRCLLADNHEGEHEGSWRKRGVFWDTSSVAVSDTSTDRWVPVEGVEPQ